MFIENLCYDYNVDQEYMNGTHRRSTGWSIFIGVLLMVLGLITLGAQAFTTLATVLFFGWMLIIGGIVQIFNGFFARGDRAISFVGGILTLIVGIIVAANPTFTAATVTLLISLLLLVSGVYYVISSLVTRGKNWGWSLTGGLLTLILGIVILTGWPVTGMNAIGLFVGLAFFVNGFFMVVNAFETSEVTEREYRQTPYVAGVKGGKAKKDKERRDEEEEMEIEDRRN